MPLKNLELIRDSEIFLSVFIDMVTLVLTNNGLSDRVLLVDSIYESVKGMYLSREMCVKLLKLVETLLSNFENDYYEISFRLLFVVVERSLQLADRQQFLYCSFLALQAVRRRFSILGLEFISKLLFFDVAFDSVAFDSVVVGIQSITPDHSKKYSAADKESYVDYVKALFSYLSMSKNFECPGFLELCTDCLDTVLSPVDARFSGQYIYIFFPIIYIFFSVIDSIFFIRCCHWIFPTLIADVAIYIIGCIVTLLSLLYRIKRYQFQLYHI
jgi:hypothetical protein